MFDFEKPIDLTITVDDTKYQFTWPWGNWEEARKFVERTIADRLDFDEFPVTMKVTIDNNSSK